MMFSNNDPRCPQCKKSLLPLRQQSDALGGGGCAFNTKALWTLIDPSVDKHSYLKKVYRDLYPQRDNANNDAEGGSTAACGITTTRDLDRLIYHRLVRPSVIMGYSSEEFETDDAKERLAKEHGGYFTRLLKRAERKKSEKTPSSKQEKDESQRGGVECGLSTYFEPNDRFPFTVEIIEKFVCAVDILLPLALADVDESNGAVCTCHSASSSLFSTSASSPFSALPPAAYQLNENGCTAFAGAAQRLSVGTFLAKQYPVLRRVTLEECKRGGFVGARREEQEDESSSSSASNSLAPHALSQGFSLCRLEIALLNLLSAFGYTRQGYPMLGERATAKANAAADGSSVAMEESPFIDANDFTLIKYFTRDDVYSHYAYSMSLVAYLTVIAEEVVGTRDLVGYQRSKRDHQQTAAETKEGGCSAPPSCIESFLQQYPSSSARALVTEFVTFTRHSSAPTVEMFAGSRSGGGESKNKIIITPNNSRSTWFGAKSAPHSAPTPLALPSYAAIPLCPIAFKNGSMFEDHTTTIVTDYANEYYGGPSTLTSTQEEILLMLKPEMLVGRQLCEVMLGHEAIVVSGARLFCNIGGYGSSAYVSEIFPSAAAIAEADEKNLKTKDFANQQQQNPKPNSLWHVPVIDAVVHAPRSGNRDADADSDEYNQFTLANRIRCTHKAFLAFDYCVKCVKKNNNINNAVNNADDENEDCHDDNTSDLTKAIIAGGRWGCGVFNGHLGLKVMQQWIAASAAGADRLDLFLFGDAMQPQIEAMVKSWRGYTVGDAAKALFAEQKVKRFSTDVLFGPAVGH